MSLINQMLQDLDARRAAHGAGTVLPPEVRPLPPVRESHWRPVLLAIVALALATGAFLYWRDALSLLSTQATQPLPTEAAEIAPQPVQETAENAVNVVNAATPLAESSSAASPPLPPLENNLRLAESLQMPVQASANVSSGTPAKPAEQAVPETRKAGDGRSRPELRQEKPRAAEPATAGPPPAASAASQNEIRQTRPPAIEKTEAAPLPGERAESEYRKAIVAVNQGRIEEAMSSLQGALRLDSLHVAARQLLVRLLLESRQSDDAMRVLQEGLQARPAQIGWAMSLARLQVERGDPAGAWTTLEHSLPAAAASADYQGFSAHVLQRLGRNKEAAEHYRQAALLAPADGRWWLGLGLAYDAEGRTNEAREAFLRARQAGNLGADLLALIEQKLK